jgi:hypothetical protein
MRSLFRAKHINIGLVNFSLALEFKDNFLYHACGLYIVCTDQKENLQNIELFFSVKPIYFLY